MVILGMVYGIVLTRFQGTPWLWKAHEARPPIFAMAMNSRAKAEAALSPGPSPEGFVASFEARAKSTSWFSGFLGKILTGNHGFYQETIVFTMKNWVSCKFPLENQSNDWWFFFRLNIYKVVPPPSYKLFLSPLTIDISYITYKPIVIGLMFTN